MAGTPHPLQPRSHRGRRLHLDHQVDRPHVDAQLEGRGGDHRLQLTAFEGIFDLETMLPCHRAVMGPGDLLSGEVVDLGADPLGEASRVGEDDGAVVGLDRLQQLGIDRRPNRTGRSLVGIEGIGGSRFGHVLDRHHDLDVELPVVGDVDHGHRARDPAVALCRSPAEEPSNGLQRALGRREADSLRRRGGDLLETLQGKGEVSPSLGAGDGVHLVDDHPSDRFQDRPGRRGEDQIEGLGRGDQDVRRPALHPLPVGSPGCLRCGERSPGRAGDSTWSRCEAWRIPARGARRLRSTSWASALSGET